MAMEHPDMDIRVLEDSYGDLYEQREKGLGCH